MADPYRLQRFVDAQEDSYARARAELERGQKTGHWMWFIFPQFAGLGSSSTSREYAIQSLDEARAYLAHPVLGPRLREITALVASLRQPPEQVFGYPDDLKLKSSMTLFARATDDNSVFLQVLERHFAGSQDQQTVALLGK